MLWIPKGAVAIRRVIQASVHAENGDLLPYPVSLFHYFLWWFVINPTYALLPAIVAAPVSESKKPSLKKKLIGLNNDFYFAYFCDVYNIIIIMFLKVGNTSSSIW
jgi:hypothetical protein